MVAQQPQEALDQAEAKGWDKGTDDQQRRYKMLERQVFRAEKTIYEINMEEDLRKSQIEAQKKKAAEAAGQSKRQRKQPAAGAFADDEHEADGEESD